MVEAAFSRHVEMEADLIAVQYLENAGYTKEDYLGLLERMADMENGSGCRVWCTHPYIEDRIQAVREGRNVLHVEVDKKDFRTD
jgi:predicted Zn-dependent protease